MNKVDLNCDLGESFGSYTIGRDGDVTPHVSSVNIACGYHGGDPLVMRQTIKLAKQHGVCVGAHPGFPDLLGFGRREIRVTADEAYCYVLYQLGALGAFAASEGLELQHMKAHGALYNMAGRDLELARALCRAVRDYRSDMIILALSGSCMVEAARLEGVRCASEFFADRAYCSDGSLAPRALDGAVIHDTTIALERVVKMVKTGKVTAIDGTELDLACESICVHGDNSSAVDFVTAIRAKLEAKNIEITPFGKFI